MILQPEQLGCENLSAEKVVEYLLAHPSLFAEYPDALAALDLPHDSGGMVSLVERQIRILREKSDTYRDQLQELVTVARETDAWLAARHDYWFRSMHWRREGLAVEP